MLLCGGKARGTGYQQQAEEKCHAAAGSEGNRGATAVIPTCISAWQSMQVSEQAFVALAHYVREPPGLGDLILILQPTNVRAWAWMSSGRNSTR